MEPISQQLTRSEVNIHPSELPENRNRCALFDKFYQSMMPEMQAFLGETFTGETPEGFQNAWRIFLGTIVEGQFYFVCHIVEGFHTIGARNCEDSTIPKYPVLLYGERFHIKKNVMDQIKQEFPSYHQGKVPFQTALAITPRDIPSYSTPQLTSLFSERSVATPNYNVSVMTPVGTESLSFRLCNFPLQFWTHGSRYQVIHTALENERAEPIQNQERINLYQDACNLEKNRLNAEEQRRTSQKELEKKNKTFIKENNSLQDLKKNPNATQQGIQRKQDIVNSLTVEISNLEGEIKGAEQALHEMDGAIAQLKQEHSEELPNSYREATFQIALDLDLPNGDVIYKQYNGVTSIFESCTEVDRQVRYGNDVHIPYSHNFN